MLTEPIDDLKEPSHIELSDKDSIDYLNGQLFGRYLLAIKRVMKKN